MNSTPTPLPIKVSFNPLIRPYLVLSIAASLCVTIVLIPLAVLWCLGIGQWWARHYFAKLECELTERTLRYRKGIIVQVEKSIPLENIQDVTFIEGPLLRYFHLSILKFETAGQSAGQAHDMKLVGIMNAQDFRNRILQARQELRDRAAPKAEQALSAEASQAALLQNIQRSLDEIIALMKTKP
jgi:membrane protein YdbS with pleckstrin-like domain